MRIPLSAYKPNHTIFELMSERGIWETRRHPRQERTAAGVI